MKTITLLILTCSVLTLPVQAQNNANVPTQHNEATIAQLQEEMALGKLTSVQLTNEYIARINALDQPGPDHGVNSIIELNPDAIALAQRADNLRKQGKVLGPLHGIPVLLKDNTDTGDKMQTTAGSFALFGKPALQDSTVAANLRAGGAVILGKTNLSEWANFRSFESTSGWSGRGGQTNNPYGLDRNPCGSSSGSAAAASGGVPLGWQGTGKTRPKNIPTDYTIFIDPHGLKGARLGLTRSGLNGFDPNVPTPQPVLDAFEEAVNALTAAGAIVIDLDAAGFTFPSAAGEFLVLAFGFRRDVTAYFASCVGVPVAGRRVHTALDLANAE